MSNPGFKPINAVDSDSKEVEEIVRPEAVLAYPVRGRVRSDAVIEDLVDAGAAMPAPPPLPPPTTRAVVAAAVVPVPKIGATEK